MASDRKRGDDYSESVSLSYQMKGRILEAPVKKQRKSKGRYMYETHAGRRRKSGGREGVVGGGEPSELW